MFLNRLSNSGSLLDSQETNFHWKKLDDIGDTLEYSPRQLLSLFSQETRDSIL
jgi:hypothetical protein